MMTSTCPMMTLSYLTAAAKTLCPMNTASSAVPRRSWTVWPPALHNLGPKPFHPSVRLHGWPRNSPTSTTVISCHPRYASSEQSRSIEWHISTARAGGLEWAEAEAKAKAYTAQKPREMMDDEELERRLNTPEAIAAAVAMKSSSSSSSKIGTKLKQTHDLRKTRTKRSLSNGATRPAGSLEETDAEALIRGSSVDHAVVDDFMKCALSVQPDEFGTDASHIREGRTGTDTDPASQDFLHLTEEEMTGAGEHRYNELADAAGRARDTGSTDIEMPEARVDKSRGVQQPRGIADSRTVLVEAVHMPHDLPEVESANDCSSEGSRQERSGGSVMTYLWKMQLKREERSQAEACEKYCKMLNDMVTLGKAVNLKPVQRILLTWYRPLMDRIEEEQAAVWQDMPDSDKDTVAKSGAFGGRSVYGPLLVLLKADKLAVLVMHEIVSLCLAEGNKGVPTLKACKQVADLVQAEVNDLRLKKRLGTKEVKKLNLSGRDHVREVNKQAERALDSLEYADWPLAARIKLGAALIKFLLETAAWSESGRPAFVHEIRSTHVKRRHGVIAMGEAVYSKMIDEDISSFVAPRFVPMVVPPQKWTRSDRGGYLRLRCQVMRTWGDKGQKEALKLADLHKVFDGLNCLAKVRWRINTSVLNVVKEAWESDTEVGDLPRRAEIPRPDIPEGLKLTAKGSVKIADKKKAEDPEMKKIASAYRRSLSKVKVKNANLHSMRCDLRLKTLTPTGKFKESIGDRIDLGGRTAYGKAREGFISLTSLKRVFNQPFHQVHQMSIAEEFRDHAIYFPYNMDFRGRTYPVPPNLNILGSDFCRGVLMFDEARALGERGLYWLKVHIANLYGEDKVSFDDRIEFTERHIDEIRDSALRPLGGEGWWMKADKPWQCLSVCRDLTAALDSPDPTQYLSRLPVHQDGSCNGLQHYAALGLDENGGAQVNLVPHSKPQDVYSGVCEVVKRKVAAEARVIPPQGSSEDVLKRHRLAKMLNGKIDRKVVKQTVMTSVYGVTFVGARKQIQNQIEQKLSNGEVLSDEDEAEVYAAASYLASLTMTVLGELFQEARGIMEWLVDVAMLVAKEGQPVTWVTPLGLPVQQPYRSNSGFQVQTLLQGVRLVEENEHLPVAIARQKSAFPPNFVHSLDSTHMLLTAMEMDKADIPFAAVHDSYWVHAGNVDKMNAQLRQCFVDLYSGPILEDLYESLRLRYPTVEFPPIPQRGTLKLEEVKSSLYFFN